jgi:hypothetical protein
MKEQRGKGEMSGERANREKRREYKRHERSAGTNNAEVTPNFTTVDCEYVLQDKRREVDWVNVLIYCCRGMSPMKSSRVCVNFKKYYIICII